MMISWYGNIFCITGPLWGESTSCHSSFTSQWASNAELWCYVLVSLNKMSRKQLRRLWFEIPWCSCDDAIKIYQCEWEHTIQLFLHFWATMHSKHLSWQPITCFNNQRQTTLIEKISLLYLDNWTSRVSFYQDRDVHTCLWTRTSSVQIMTWCLLHQVPYIPNTS